MTKYLYGASVQGIQGFIFQTNELQDIIGASEIVERVCTSDFEPFSKGGELIVGAAGNVKCLYEEKNKALCEKVVKYFPKTIMEKAPGITISQAVVAYDDDDFASAVEKLESRLRAQRNRPMPSLTTGLMAMERSRKTGLPAVAVKDGEYIDEGTYRKKEKAKATFKLCRYSFGEAIGELSYKNVAFNIEEMTGNNDWIAIIHADGNGLGQIVSRIGKEPGKLHEFSENLDNAVKKAAQRTFKKLNEEYHLVDNKKKIPLRPIVLSGDDMTIITRGDLAVPYAKLFMQFFEEETKAMGHQLTACAGIAYIKSSYPFYYGYNLAETLCNVAKKDAKKKEHLVNGLPPSCLAFHKVQSSFVEDYNEILAKEKTPQDGLSLEFGPYYLHKEKARQEEQTFESGPYYLHKEKTTTEDDPFESGPYYLHKETASSEEQHFEPGPYYLHKEKARQEGQSFESGPYYLHKEESPLDDQTVESGPYYLKISNMQVNEHSFEFGPYYLHSMEGRWTIDKLQQQAEKLVGKEGNAAKSSLRQWITILHDDVGQAEQRKERILTIVPKSMETLVRNALQGEMRNALQGEEHEGKKCYPAQDILTLHTINTQQTK